MYLILIYLSFAFLWFHKQNIKISSKPFTQLNICKIFQENSNILSLLLFIVMSK